MSYMAPWSQSRSLLLSLIVLFGYSLLVNGQRVTRVGFYSRTCPNAESIVQSTVTSHFRADPRVAPGLLRMHFHDCFVQGCDGSVLINGADSERTAGANLGLFGFEVIDDAKTQLEAACPGVVSCADILALAARDSVVLTRGPSWRVPTGRKDGRVSLASNVNNLPAPSDSVAVQKRKFAAFGLNTRDLVTLVGGHTIGTTACGIVRRELFDATGNSTDPAFQAQLQRLCPQNGGGSGRVALDIGSPNTFDTSFFTNLRSGRGLLQSDQRLWTDRSTRAVVQRFLTARGNFNTEFARAMVKMSNIRVKTGTNGEIRRVCSAVN